LKELLGQAPKKLADVLAALLYLEAALLEGSPEFALLGVRFGAFDSLDPLFCEFERSAGLCFLLFA